jgi:ADP-dependent NAD(P)H-hydrate dehydratase / NAD(P)H-hydrate epimerase
MKICTAAEVREWDRYTILHEPIASIDLMERAAIKCADWLLVNNSGCNAYCVLCGNGNNGGDGLAIGRLLAKAGMSIRVFICHPTAKNSNDFDTNLARLVQETSLKIHLVKEQKDLPVWDKNETIIEAVFGIGLSRPPLGIAEMIISHINQSGCPVIAIDIPGGMCADVSSKGNAIVRAAHTLSFQCFKPAFLMPGNAAFTGQQHILDIGLHQAYYHSMEVKYLLVTPVMIHSIYKKREPFAHKGNFGHALLVAGSDGKMGATVLSAKACLRSGVGLLTCHVPQCGFDIVQVSVPEAMVNTDENSSTPAKINLDFSVFSSLGAGPGIGTGNKTIQLLKDIFGRYKKPMVLDADALNCMAADASLLHALPAGSILTPHLKEFERLFGKSANDFDRTEKALQYAKHYNVVIVLKGHRSFIATPGGYGYFNSTGNAGMATAGSGDVLTGIITGLLAQGYSQEQAAVLGVYLHGLAGDIAAELFSQEAMIAGDIVASLGEAFKRLR